MALGDTPQEWSLSALIQGVDTVSASNPLPVSLVGGGGGSTSVNVASVGGAAIALGPTVAAAGLPITFPTNQAVSVSGIAGVATVAGAVSVAGTATVTGATAALAATSGGALKASTIVGSTGTYTVKASPGQVYGLQSFNNSTVPAWVKLYDATTAGVGSGTPVWRGLIPGNALGSGFILSDGTGIQFSTGIMAIVTAGILDNDTVAAGANAIVLNFLYK